MLTAFRAGRIRRGAVVRVLEFTRLAVGSERIIIVQKLEVLQTDCMMVGSPTRYPFISLEEVDAESVGSSTELNYGAYSAVQGLKGNLTRGMLALLQQPVMQVVGVSLMSSELKKFEMFHLVLSDGVHTQDTTLAFHLNHLIKNTHLRKGTIVRLLKFMCNTFQGPSLETKGRNWALVLIFYNQLVTHIRHTKTRQQFIQTMLRWMRSLIIIQVMYTGMFIINKAALDHGMNIFIFIFYLQAAASLLLLPIAVLLERRNARFMSFLLLSKLFFCALIGITISFNLYNVSLKLTSATVASASVKASPVLTFCVALLLRMEKVKLRSLSGIAKVTGVMLKELDSVRSY